MNIVIVIDGDVMMINDDDASDDNLKDHKFKKICFYEGREGDNDDDENEGDGYVDSDNCFIMHLIIRQ